MPDVIERAANGFMQHAAQQLGCEPEFVLEGVDVREAMKAAFRHARTPINDMIERAVTIADTPDFIGLSALDVWQGMIDEAVGDNNRPSTQENS